jgi:hypothetical protein
MKRTYFICYDLNNKDKDYEGLKDKIKEIAGKWWHHLDSTWIIKSSRSAVEIRDLLKPFIDSDDELLVALYGKEAAWKGFNTEGSEWLKDNLGY